MDLLTLSEVAVMLRTPEATLRFWRANQKGPRSIKVGRRVMYVAADVQKWVEGLHYNGSDDAA